jgi:hypothetical protein
MGAIRSVGELPAKMRVFAPAEYAVLRPLLVALVNPVLTS